MTNFELILPESLHSLAHTIAEKKGITLNELIITALAEKIVAMKMGRASRGSRKKFDAILRKVPKRDAIPGDEL